MGQVIFSSEKHLRKETRGVFEPTVKLWYYAREKKNVNYWCKDIDKMLQHAINCDFSAATFGKSITRVDVVIGGDHGKGVSGYCSNY